MSARCTKTKVHMKQTVSLWKIQVRRNQICSEKGVNCTRYIETLNRLYQSHYSTGGGICQYEDLPITAKKGTAVVIMKRNCNLRQK